MVMIPGLEGIDWFGFLSQMMYWLGIFVACVVLMCIMAVVYAYATYNVPVRIKPLYGGTDGFTIGKPKSNRVKWNATRTEWRALFPLFNRKVREPFPQQFIGEGTIEGYSINDEWIPASQTVDVSPEGILVKISPVPAYLRNWQSLTHKKHNMEYASLTFWDQNKTLIVALLMGVAMLVAGLVFIYISYEYSSKMWGGQTSAINGLTEAMKNFGTTTIGAPG